MTVNSVVVAREEEVEHTHTHTHTHGGGRRNEKKGISQKKAGKMEVYSTCTK